MSHSWRLVKLACLPTAAIGEYFGDWLSSSRQAEMIVVHRILCPLRRLGSARVPVVENLTRMPHRRDVHCQSPQIYTKRFWKTTTSGCMAKIASAQELQQAFQS
ncbi:uncharacterized protein AKAW2_81139S [Aspergillus luchuensis]|uniref:Secreted protein n=1 Tax=Aspergillus kawachii TaxID=1069201 RepID=A0A7R7WLR0_ASPKA|nr:uncharacterized protein AKAW2_81139S [Aspergillus luchuensis]BCS05338.1 hypothetical protein AKAW2_81139S [Aspergillus luchuensis]